MNGTDSYGGRHVAEATQVIAQAADADLTRGSADVPPTGEPSLEEPRPPLPLFKGKPPVAAYPYVDERGEHLFTVARYQFNTTPDGGYEKTFRQYRLIDGEWKPLGDQRRVLYRLPELLEHIAEGRRDTIFIPEGEKDADAIVAAGGIATCNPMGAGKWTDDYSDMLRGARQVAIVVDLDPDSKRRADTGLTPGEQHALTVRDSLRRVGIAPVLIQARVGKDAADHLAGGHTLDDFLEWTKPGTAAAGAPGVRICPRPSWLVDAADLLAEPDPGPTSWLVHDLIVDRSIVAAVGRWKTTKSYALLDICIAIATGEPAFGRYAIPKPGPVLFINEESGQDALRRRVEALCRGRSIDAERLRDRLLLAANRRIRLDDAGWQRDLLDTCCELRPRLVVFDPLARMKAPGRDENAQTDMAPLLDFLRHLRDDASSAVCFVHHSGHAGEHMRGSSDLESFWESRLHWERDGQASVVKLTAEHREAEAADPLHYTIDYDPDRRAMRFTVPELKTGPTLADRILNHLTEHGPATTDEVLKGVGIRASDGRRVLDELSQAGTVCRTPSEYADAKGRRRNRDVWNLSNQAVLDLTTGRPDSRTDTDAEPVDHRSPSQAVPNAPHRGAGGGRDEAPDDEAELPWKAE